MSLKIMQGDQYAIVFTGSQDGKPLDMTGITWRWYPGNEAQAADPFISAKMGAANTPAFRGTAYVVFEELAAACPSTAAFITARLVVG